MDSLLGCGRQSRNVGIALEYLRLFGFSTIAWVMGSALIAAMPLWRVGDLRAFLGAVSLAGLAFGLGLLLTRYAKLSQATALAVPLGLSLLSVGLIRFGMIHTQFLMLLCYTLLFISSTAIIIAMFPSDNPKPDEFDQPPGDPSPMQSPESLSIPIPVAMGKVDTAAASQLQSEMDPHADVTTSEPKSQSLKRSFAWSWIGLILLVALAIYMVVVPAISMVVSSFTPKPTSKLVTEMTFAEFIRLHTVSGVVMLLFLATGASVGSFLNVVIYRLPRGLRLLWPPSACPNCGYKIKGWDNLPILAWIGLKGSCRQCHVPISSRYPLIELTVAAVFVALYYLELLSAGGSLPIREPNTYKGVVWVLLYTKWDLVSIYFLHALMLTVLLAWGMINYDRFRVPKLSGLLVVGIASVCMVLVPFLNPTVGVMPQSPIPSPIASCLVGLVAGAIGGSFLQLTFPNKSSSTRASSETASQVEALIEGSSPTYPSAEASLLVDNQQADLTGPIAPERNFETEVYSLGDADANPSPPTVESKFNPMDLYGTVSNRPQFVTDAMLSMLLVGAILGPSAVVVITLVTAVIGCMWALTGLLGLALPRAPITLQLFGVATVFVVLWRQSSRVPFSWWPKPESNLGLALTWLGVLAIAAIVSGLVRAKGASLSSGPTSNL